jgi:hypothetical protein
VHLAAAGLSGGEVDGVAEALEDADDGLPGGGEEGVVIAGDEEGDAQEASALVAEFQYGLYFTSHLRSGRMLAAFG